MKNLTLFFVFFFSLINAQVSERINLPDYYNAQSGRMLSTGIIEEIYKGSKEVKVTLIEADEKSVMYRVNFMLNENSRKNFDMRVYFYDTYILINSFNYTSEIQKVVKGKKVYQKIESDAEYQSIVNEVLDGFVRNGFVKIIKTQIWRQ